MSRYVNVNNDPLLHVNNNNNMRVFANVKIHKCEEFYWEEVSEILKKVKVKM